MALKEIVTLLQCIPEVNGKGIELTVSQEVICMGGFISNYFLKCILEFLLLKQFYHNVDCVFIDKTGYDSLCDWDDGDPGKHNGQNHHATGPIS